MAAAARGQKNKKIAQTEAQATLDSVKDLELDTVLGEVGTLQVSVQNTLANLGTSLAGKIQQLTQVDDAIALKQARLLELFEIEKESITIDDLRTQRDNETQDWAQKSRERSQRWQEEEADRQKAWKREAEDYTYVTKSQHRKTQEEFESSVSKALREEDVRKENLGRDWATREKALSEREEELASLRSQVANFDTRLKAEVAKAESLVGNTVKRQYEHEMALVKKDMENENRLHDSFTKQNQQIVHDLHAQIKTLQEQLTAARLDVKEISTTAVNGNQQRQVVETLSQHVRGDRENNPRSK